MTCPNHGCTFNELLLLLFIFMFQHKALKLSDLVLTMNFVSSFMTAAVLLQSGQHRSWWLSAVSAPAIVSISPALICCSWASCQSDTCVCVHKMVISTITQPDWWSRVLFTVFISILLNTLSMLTEPHLDPRIVWSQTICCLWWHLKKSSIFFLPHSS